MQNHKGAFPQTLKNSDSYKSISRTLPSRWTERNPAPVPSACNCLSMDMVPSASLRAVLWSSTGSVVIIGFIQPRARSSSCLHSRRVRFWEEVIVSLGSIGLVIRSQERLRDDLIFKLNRPEAQPISVCIKPMTVNPLI